MWVATTTRASPHSCLPWSALPKETLSGYCARQQNLSTKNFLSEVRSNWALFLEEPPLNTLKLFFFSDCKSKGVLFLIHTETVEASWFTAHGGWIRVSVRGKPFPAQKIIILAKVDPFHIGDFCSLSPIASLWTLLIITLPPWPCSFHQATLTAGVVCASPTFFCCFWHGYSPVPNPRWVLQI